MNKLERKTATHMKKIPIALLLTDFFTIITQIRRLTLSYRQRILDNGPIWNVRQALKM